jgi:hypothetical protein
MRKITLRPYYKNEFLEDPTTGYEVCEVDGEVIEVRQGLIESKLA